MWPRELLALCHAVLDPTFPLSGGFCCYHLIIFFPSFQKPSMFDVSRELGSSVALYSRKVLIQTKATDILPKWLRFVRGTVAATQALVWTWCPQCHGHVSSRCTLYLLSQTTITQWDSACSRQGPVAPLGNSRGVLVDQGGRGALSSFLFRNLA